MKTKYEECKRARVTVVCFFRRNVRIGGCYEWLIKNCRRADAGTQYDADLENMLGSQSHEQSIERAVNCTGRRL